MKRAKFLLHHIAVDHALPALDWGAVLSPLLHSDVCGQFVNVVALFVVEGCHCMWGFFRASTKQC